MIAIPRSMSDGSDLLEPPYVEATIHVESFARTEWKCTIDDARDGSGNVR